MLSYALESLASHNATFVLLAFILCFHPVQIMSLCLLLATIQQMTLVSRYRLFHSKHYEDTM